MKTRNRTETFSVTNKLTGETETWTQEITVPTLEEIIERAYVFHAISAADRDSALAELAELRAKAKDES